MARMTITMAALAATIITAMVPAAAMAQDRYGDGYGGYGGYGGYDQRQGDWQRPGDDRRGWRDDRGGYEYREETRIVRDYRRAPIRYVYRDDRPYHNQGGYVPAYRGPVSYGYRCQASGTTGAIVGALAGGLLGNGLAGRGDRTLGTLLGGGAGALAGRAIDRSNSGC